MSNFESFDNTEDQAYWWVAKLTSGNVSDQDRQGFVKWCAANANNHPAFLAAQSLWIEMGDSINTTESALSRSNEIDFGQEVDFKPSSIASDSVTAPTIQPPVVYRFRNMLSVAALGFVIAIFTNFANSPSLITQLQADFRSGAGTQSVYALADGSQLEINTASALTQNSLRSLTLMAGEIYLTVESDPTNPFVVDTEFGTVTAIGTEFLVKNIEDKLTIGVTEGVVKVQKGAQNYELTADQQLILGEGLEPELAQLDRNQLAWRDQKIIFEETPLVEVIAELNRYLPGKVVLLDKGLAETPINAVFNLENVDTALQVLEQNLPIQLSYITTYLALVY